MPVMIGAAIALLLISFFLFTAGEPNPEWGRFWRIRPLVIVPLAGAIGGAFFHFMVAGSRRGGWRKQLRILLGILLYIIALWLGTVLGLDGTYWD